MNDISYEERVAIYREALQLYGPEMQTAVAIEEMSELTKALIKVQYRQGHDMGAVIEELADATIMLEQLRLMYDINDEVCAVMDEKVIRLARNIVKDRQTWRGEGKQ